MNKHAVPPYDTGKVKIGLMYNATPVPRTLTSSEELLQRALLYKPNPSIIDRLLARWRV